MSLTIGTVKFVSKRLASLMVLVVFISACTTMPESIQNEGAQQISVQAVQQNSANYKGQTVRWGGVITQVINYEQDTWIEILSLQLSGTGRPSGNRRNNQGRFIAKVDKFLDPEVYQEGYSVTVIGILSDNIDGKIGSYNYSFPVVAVQGHHLWQKRSYRSYPSITPGYWYYGFYPYWGFGYRYYGFGVRHLHGYYPYYPVFGRLAQRDEPLPNRHRSGVFQPANDRLWQSTNNHFTTRRSESRVNNSHSNSAHSERPRVHRPVATPSKPARQRMTRHTAPKPQRPKQK